jgi:DNA replication protein DnaC
MKTKELHFMEITNYDDWNDGLDFRPTFSHFCEKCGHKGTFLKKAADPETGLSYTIAQDCECKVEYIAKMRMKAAGIHPSYRDLDCKTELNEKEQQALDKFYEFYKDENKIAKNLLLYGPSQAKKTKFLALSSKYLIMKSLNLTVKYITFHDLLLTINKTWKTGDYSEVEEFYSYDILIIDKVESGTHFVKQNMNMVTFNSIFDKRDLEQRPTIVSCGKLDDLDYINLDASRFITREMK